METMSVFRLFKQPFPHDSSWPRRLKTAAAFGVFVAVFLFIFKPFELDRVSTAMLVRGCIVFGGIVFACISGTHVLLHFFFPGSCSEDRWTTGKQILNMGIVVVLVGFVNFLVTPLLFDIRLNWNNILRNQGIALSVGILPITMYTMYAQNRFLKKYKKEAADIQEKLDKKKEADEGEMTTVLPGVHQHESAGDEIHESSILFKSDNQAENKTIAAADLVYIEAASNYIKLFFTQKQKLTYSILRMTMKNAAMAVSGHTVFFRCHRAFIINLDKIEKVEGNAQGYKLKMQGAEELVPVSRNLNREFSDRLLEYRKEKE